MEAKIAAASTFGLHGSGKDRFRAGADHVRSEGIEHGFGRKDRGRPAGWRSAADRGGLRRAHPASRLDGARCLLGERTGPMLTLPAALKVFAKTTPTDMRKSFDGLMGLVELELGQTVESGHLFLFFNRRRDRV